MMTALLRKHCRRRNQGTVLIVTMWIVLVLAGLVLVFTHSARVDALASANLLASMEADATAKGALEFARSVLDGTDGSTESLQDYSWEARQVGSGVFWMVRPNLDDDRDADFGLVDEASRININSASSDMLLKLPGMTAELADAIMDWRDEDSDISPSGAESEYYLLGEPPYYCKNSEFETVEELLLVRGASADVLYGEDTDRDDLLDLNENDGSDSDPPDNANGSLDRGIISYITVHSSEPNTSADGQQRIDVNNRDTQQISDLLAEVVDDDRRYLLLVNIRAGQPYDNILEFYYQSDLTAEEFSQIADRLTAGEDEERAGLVNVNTAPRDVLLCLPELDENDVDELISHRQDSDADTSSIAWVAEILDQEKGEAIGSFITTRSYQFSADIVAASRDGRAYKRYRAVLDARVSPPKVLLWQDLTHLGWPLGPGVLAELQRGEL
jgi:type II secretory pathway component PulK